MGKSYLEEEQSKINFPGSQQAAAEDEQYFKIEKRALDGHYNRAMNLNVTSIKGLLKKYKSFIFYAVFGVLTTAINIHLNIANVPSNILAWTFAVAFAFITNKLWVFGSKNMSVRTILNELWKFITARLAVGLVDLAIMYVAVDICHGPGVVFKVVAGIVTIVLNFVLSKLVVFRKAKPAKSEESAE